MKYQEHPDTFTATVRDLCEQVDAWKSQAAYWKEQFEQERKERTALLNENLESAKKGVGQALLFALSVREDGNGNLVIPKENRGTLANSHKP